MRITSPLLQVALGTVVLTSALPARAAEPASSESPPPVLGSYRPNPWLAGAMTASAPLVFAVAVGAFPSTELLGPPRLLSLGLAGLVLGSGHAYAGDPIRGAKVGAGGLGLVGVGMGGLYLASLATPPGGGAQSGFGTLLLGLGLTTVAALGYTGWAAYDAYKTAEPRSRPE